MDAYPGRVAGEDVKEKDEGGHAAQGDEVAGFEASDLHDGVNNGEQQRSYREQDTQPVRRTAGKRGKRVVSVQILQTTRIN